MSEFPNKFKIIMELDIKGAFRKDGDKLFYDVEIDTGKLKRFAKKLAALCRKHGFTVEADIITDTGKTNKH